MIIIVGTLLFLFYFVLTAVCSLLWICAVVFLLDFLFTMFMAFMYGAKDSE